jgi:D-alanine-D-alanine ligase
MKIAILSGGDSPEREISIKSGQQVYKALSEKSHQLKLFDPAEKDFAGKLIRFNPECVFVALHGNTGEGGEMQGFLEILNLPYTGSDTASSSLCMNKITAKKILKSEGLPTPEFIVMKKGGDISVPFDLPVVIKPASLGSTIGIEIVKDIKKLKDAVSNCFRLDREVFMEKYIKGKEIAAGILGNEEIELLPVIEISTKTGFYDYDAKYIQGKSQHIIPARLPAKTMDKINEITERTYKTLGCSGFARIDMMVEGENPYIIEINTIPGLTETSLLPDAAKKQGISFSELCEKIINLAMEKWAEKQKKE